MKPIVCLFFLITTGLSFSQNGKTNARDISVSPYVDGTIDPREPELVHHVRGLAQCIPDHRRMRLIEALVMCIAPEGVMPQRGIVEHAG